MFFFLSLAQQKGLFQHIFVSTAKSACFNTFYLFIEGTLLFPSHDLCSNISCLNATNNGIRKEILILFESTQQREVDISGICAARKEFNIVETTRIHYALYHVES